MNVNTTNFDTQANHADFASIIPQIRQRLFDIEDQSLSIQTLGGMVYDQIDAMSPSDPVMTVALLRIDALVKAMLRNAVLTQEAMEAVSAMLSEGGAA